MRISSDEIINSHCDIFSKISKVFAVVRIILIVAGSSLRYDRCTVWTSRPFGVSFSSP